MKVAPFPLSGWLLGSAAILSGAPDAFAQESDKTEVADDKDSKDTEEVDEAKEVEEAKNSDGEKDKASDDPAEKDEPSPFRDPEDNAFDMSAWLERAYGFMPIPSLITEPALGGIGGLLGLAFLGARKEDEKIPPNIFFVGGGYTANASWFTAAGYRGFWDQGRTRVGAWGFYAQPNIDLYVTVPVVGEVSTQAEIEAYGGGARFMRRVAALPIYLGGFTSDKQIHLTFDSEAFGDAVDVPELTLNQNQLQIFGSAEIDTRNNYFSPTSGSYLRLDAGYNRVRGDAKADFGEIYLAAHHFFDLRRVVLGFRAINAGVLGSAPFYLRPYVSLRGVPLARYQGDYAFSLESEEMIRLTERFGVVVFGGWGKALSRQVNFSEAENAWNVGTGFRYLIARLYGLRMGVDVARGPEQFAWYVQFGHAWGAD